MILSCNWLLISKVINILIFILDLTIILISFSPDYYLVTDSEGNIGNMHFLHPISEPQGTKPELLQENKNDIVGNKTLHCGKSMDMFKKFYKEHGQNEPRCELTSKFRTATCK
jgi:hypothetical protein